MSGFSRNVSAGTLPITENIKLFLMKQSVWIFTGCDVAWNCRDLDYGLWFVCQVRERDKTQTIKGMQIFKFAARTDGVTKIQ